jgi:UDP-glucose 4-epimerase
MKEKPNILVTGGAGYIGSHMVKLLMEKEYNVTTLDNLSTGHRDAVLGGRFIKGDLADSMLLHKLFSETNFDIVVHFAASSIVSESTLNPDKYYRNNVTNTQNILDVMIEHKVKNIIFSSSAAVYGQPISSPIKEVHPLRPINPYGRTKMIVEEMLHDYDVAYGLRSVSLRYFNAAGASPDLLLGERHSPETHLIPLVLEVASGYRKEIYIFGTDYSTSDGTPIRDYIHVSDLCDAHFLALSYLLDGGASTVCNLGNGNGYSVLEVIDSVRMITGHRIPIITAARRFGDPEKLVADAEKATSLLGWKPQYSDLSDIVRHAWDWEKKIRKEVRNA